jgi:hypothetical protein
VIATANVDPAWLAGRIAEVKASLRFADPRKLDVAERLLLASFERQEETVEASARPKLRIVRND